MRSRGGAVLALLAAILACALSAAPAHAADPLSKVLVFSKTAGFRHDSIPQGIAAIQKLGTENNFTVTASEDATVFTDANLAQYDVIVFMSTTGDILNKDQQDAFERYMHAGGGWVGVHAASDTEYTWPYYGQMVGAYFRNHPSGTPQATIRIEDGDEPSTTGIPAAWTRNDEWYNFQKPSNPVVNGNQPGIPDYSPRTSGVHVLATVDESTYDEVDDSAEADDHPIAWCSNFDGGRAWYTGIGHTQATFSEPDALKHLLGGLKTAAKAVDADCGPERQRTPTNDDFEVATLAKGADKIGEPIGMDVLPDRRVLHTARDGRLFITTPNSVTSVAAQLNVYSHDEDGLQGVAVDPNFTQNKWVYLFYAPRLSTPLTDSPTDGDDAAFAAYKGYNLVSRFKLGDNGKLDLASEQEILRIPTDRGQCCHVGGDMDFDAQGNLYIVTGDDTNPFSSDGYAPLDDRANKNPAFDARRTSGNTNDLRGKVLRIKVQDNGTYTIPAGNMFTPGTMGTKPEIYAMGFRNPFRFSVDKKTGYIYLGEYGPDAGAANANRGPGGLVEFNLIKQPGNYGWPYCIGKNQAYNDYDFATQSGPKFNCAALKNESRHNTGLVDIPAAVPAWIDYDGGSIPEFGSGSESPMGGPTYQFDAANPSTTKFPAYFDGKNFAYEYGRAWIKTFTGGTDGTFPAVETWFQGFPIKKPIDMTFGPDGALYVLDYGTGGFFQGDENSAVYRIDYVQGARSPIVKATADKTSGPAPLTVKFSAEGSLDPDGTPLTYAWDFDGNGTVDSTAISPTYTYTTAGKRTATLTIKDATGQEAFSSFNITAGNTAPTVKINLPPQGAFFDYGDKIKYTVTVTDPEDGTIDCAKVSVNTALGHNDHSHGDQSMTGCSGEFTIPGAWEDKTQHIWYIVSASYTDKTTGLELTGSSQVELEWKTLQGEQADVNSGFTPNLAASGAGGNGRMGYTDVGDYLRFDKINLVGIDSVTFRTSGTSAGRIELHADSPTGPLVANVPVTASGDWEKYLVQAPAAITDPGGTRDLYIVAATTGFDIDELTFNGAGANGNAAPNLTANASTLAGGAPLKVDFTSSAVDPEGKAVTYAWNFGVAGATATTANASYTYTQRGIYTATVTATDADGRKSSKSFQIEVLGTCPGTDTFTGSTLDRTVWPTITREDAANYKVENGVLKINAVAGDLWTGAVTAKNIVSRPAPAGVWTATTKVSLAQVANGEQAAIVLSQGNAEIYKAAFIRTAEGRNVEFVGLRAGTDAYVARSAIFPTDAGNTVYLRMQSDGTNLTVWFSRDGVNFTQVGEARPLDRMTSPQIGISAFNGTAGTPASFEWFNLSTANDEFDGTTLNDCRWSVLRPVANEVRVQDGELQIDTIDGDLYNGTDTAKNVLLQPAPQAGKWEATTKVKLAQGGSYEQGGLVLYKDSKNFIKLMLMDTEGSGFQLEFGQDLNGVTTNVTSRDRTANLPATANTNGVWLKLVGDGGTVSAQWSLDGVTWTSFSVAKTLTGAKVGLAGYHGQGQPARFDFFRIGSGVPANRAPVITATTATPNKGTAPLKPQYDVTATDADGDTLTYAWDLNGDGTTDSTAKNPTTTFATAGVYTAKVTVSDGTLTASATVVVTVEGASTSTPVELGSDVAPTLGLTLSTATGFPAFVPGETRDYTTSTTATVVSTAGDAALTVNDPGAAKSGYLSNGSYALAKPLQVKAGAGEWKGVPSSLATWTGPIGKTTVDLQFKQSIAENDPLRSGRYGTTLVFTLSTTTP
ncbi:glucose/arabinose dehydrogenase [Solirubrobacter pauli]|uniref:Glucose/arabinose dehydrogenase n=1 Tax=Solirubrobacter pauli TaxID=166793 RepID=A0A660LEM9_9ACTN|nr:ThuA domain-containing protein [Solirubrobacter pauli]RKQ92253.1 glucose/arabinose dehydrogenase [Solirubrobacter pauli]